MSAKVQCVIVTVSEVLHCPLASRSISEFDFGYEVVVMFRKQYLHNVFICGN
jgi:signal-transduction protein with cAMP-binding, CBS, and nucleotidyltransferase domain